MEDTHVDAVVVGSGFGGSVIAYRLAEAGLRVTVLERGRPYPPGSFARSPYAMKHNLWNPSAGLYGLFNIWSFQGLNGLISSGLGGGSLIYANVLLRKDEKWFVREDAQTGACEPWPISRADLDPHYDRVEAMLNGQAYPFDQPPYNATPKTKAFAAAAALHGLPWLLPKLAVTFGNPGEAPAPGQVIHEAHPNYHGPTAVRYTCRLCGECDVGCNYGSKNTLDYTYLTEAQRLGAQIRPLCEVRGFAPREDGGYTVTYVQHDLSREGTPADTSDPAVLPPQTITADRLILSAGTFGSTFLLLKNRDAFPLLSPCVGTQFSDNGDLLAFALKCSDNSNGARVPRVIDPAHGPVITSTIRIPDELDGDGAQGRGFYLQDAGYPEFVNWMLQMVDAVSAPGEVLRVAAGMMERLFHHDLETDWSGDIAQFFGSCELSAGVLPLLGMGRDSPSGHMWLREDGRLDVDWSLQRSAAYFDRVRAMMGDISASLGATFVDDPIWRLSRVITVHPLGGCPMGRDKAEGVVDACGAVFDYPDLYVADGSVMPSPVGANPSLTIAAFADRCADAILARRRGVRP